MRLMARPITDVTLQNWGKGEEKDFPVGENLNTGMELKRELASPFPWAIVTTGAADID